MTDLNEKAEIIFDCAKGLFDISAALKEINPGLSDLILYCSDKVLKLIEPSEEEIKNENPNKQQSFEEFCEDENCPDCGELKTPPQHHQEICPDCGGIKHDSCDSNDKPQPQPVQQTTQKQPTQEIIFDDADPSSMCHGHTGDGPSTPPIQQQTKKTETPENVKSDIRGLIDQIRKGL